MADRPTDKRRPVRRRPHRVRLVASAKRSAWPSSGLFAWARPSATTIRRSGRTCTRRARRPDRRVCLNQDTHTHTHAHCREHKSVGRIQDNGNEIQWETASRTAFCNISENKTNFEPVSLCHRTNTHTHPRTHRVHSPKRPADDDNGPRNFSATPRYASLCIQTSTHIAVSSVG